MSLWSEIRQRRITQIVVTYLAGGWIVTSVIDQVVDREVLPPVVYEVTLTLFLFGILAALIVGWYHGEKGEQKAPPIEITMLSVIALLAVGTSTQVVRRSMAEASLADAIDRTDLRRIAVLYLQDGSRDGSLEAVSEGITEGLIASLASVRELEVRSRNASREASALGDVAVDSIASVLGVGAVIDGTVDQSGDELRVSIRLLEGETGTPLFRETFSWPADRVAFVGTELATEVATALREQLGGEIRLREAEAQAPNAAAWLQVARAEAYIRDAQDAFENGDAGAYIQALEAADAELVAAQTSAPEWAEPLVLRSQVAYEWYPLAQSLDELVETMDRSATFADDALRLDANSPAALERRGTATYRKWFTMRGQQIGRGELDDMFERARTDLERSETLDPDRPSALSTLSHLYYQVDDLTGAALAARTAYQQDAFLALADEVLWRLFTTAYDLEESTTAAQWCDEGRRRFPDDFRFTQCRILRMTMPGVRPDPAQAWALYDEYVPMLYERPDFFAAQARVMVGAVLGLAEMPDSADTVLRGARLDADVDPARELLAFEAGMRALIGDSEESISLLERYVLANPEAEVGEGWWWRSLSGRPDFERLRTRR